MKDLVETYDIISICETKLDDKISPYAIKLSNMTLFRNDRNNNGGGVACYVKNHLKPLHLKNLDNAYQEKGFETISVKICCKLENIILITIYKPPNSHIDCFQHIQDLIHDASTHGKVILLGDLNADILSPQSNPGKTLIDVIQNTSLQLPPKIDPTRVTSRSATCLDIIAPDAGIKIIKYEVIPNAASDHMPVIAQLQLTSIDETLKPIYKISYRNVDWELFIKLFMDQHGCPC